MCTKIGAHDLCDNVMMENVPSLSLVKDSDWNPLSQLIMQECCIRRIMQLFVRNVEGNCDVYAPPVGFHQ